MLSEADKRGWDEIDAEAQKAGGYLRSMYPFTQDYDYRGMSRYCRDKGITHDDLTDAELKLFEFNPPLVFG